MGIFHCPVGAAYYDDEPCIDCRLCLAKTKEESVEASKKMREYLRSHNTIRNGKSKKVAICGKGGTGKSTITALLTIALQKLVTSILVLDMDESNQGLYRMLGFTSQPKSLVSLLERFTSSKEKLEVEWLKQNEISLESIPGEYILELNNLKFMMAGKIDDPFQGCACSIADLARDFIEKLIVKDTEIVLIDMEAGIESFGRGVERGVDTALIIVEPSFESLALTEKISYMADGIGINKVRAILNRIPSAEIETDILNNLAEKNITAIGKVYLDDQIAKANWEGKPLPPNLKAKSEINKIAQILLGA